MTIKTACCRLIFDKNMLEYDPHRDVIRCPICNQWTEYIKTDDKALKCVYLSEQMNHQKPIYTIYSDRMMQWDLEKFNKCCEQVWDNDMQTFYTRHPKEIERFLSLYLDDAPSLLLVGIFEGENYHNGYPYWAFVYQRLT